MSDSGKTLTNQPSLLAVRHLVQHMEDSYPITKYGVKGVKIEELFDVDGTIGHSVLFPFVGGTLKDSIVARITDYAESEAYWLAVLPEFDHQAKGLMVTFLLTEKQRGEEEPSRSLKEIIDEWMTPKERKVAKAAANLLVDHGFRVREPTSAAVLTKDKIYSGQALRVKYPISSANDEAGVTKAYDKFLPRMIDSFVRPFNVKSESQIDDDIVTLFFTSNKNYTSSLYDGFPQFRMILPKAKSSLLADWGLIKSATYRACKKLRDRYRKDFMIAKYPLPAWGGNGHCIVMHYRKGAGGKVVDESYLLAIRRMTEKLMKQLHVNASLQVQTETRTIVATFTSGNRDRENWSKTVSRTVISGSTEGSSSGVDEPDEPVASG